MEINETKSESQLTHFIQAIQYRHLNIPQLLKDTYCKSSNVTEDNSLQQRKEQLQKFHDLYQAYKKHR